MILKDCLEIIIDNRGRNPKYYDNEAYPVIDNVMIKNNYHPNIKEATRFINQDTHDNFLRGYLEPNIPIMTLVGGGIGNVSLAIDDKSVIVQNTIGFKTKAEILDSVYLYYWFLYKHDELIQFNRGSGQPSIRKTDIENMNIELKNINYQRKVSKILSKIDEKIALNNEINNNLHEYAQKLFKEWFIKFNYPTSNKKKKNSELGLIPDDWKVGYFGDNILSKIIKSGVTKFNDEKKYVATADVSNSSINSFTMVKYDDKPSRANMTPIANSIWFAKMEGSKKNILVTNYTRELLNNYIFSTGFMGIECINNSINYLWELINSDSFVLEKDALSTGTLMAGISNSTITNYKYLIPTDEVLNKFNKIINVINNKIYNNQIQNKRLEQLRDTLLPKLMDGEIDLDNIEI